MAAKVFIDGEVGTTGLQIRARLERRADITLISLPEDQRRQVGERIGQMIEAPGWQLLELALASRAELAVVPLQDLLSLGDHARFNTPGTAGEANWSWRLEQPVEQLSETIAALVALAARYGRAAAGGTR